MDLIWELKTRKCRGFAHNFGADPMSTVPGHETHVRFFVTCFKVLQTYGKFKKRVFLKNSCQTSKKYGKFQKKSVVEKQFPNSYKLTANLHKFAQIHTQFAQFHIKCNKNT